MSVSENQVDLEQGNRSDIRVSGIIEPFDTDWTDGLQACIFRVSKGAEVSPRVQPDERGFFRLNASLSDGLSKLLLEGDLAVALFWQKQHLVGLRQLRPAKPSRSFAIRVPVGLARSDSSTTDIIPLDAVRLLAERVARLVGTQARNARAPRTVVNAIKGLNAASRLAARVVSGDKLALKQLLEVFDASAVYHPGGIVGEAGGDQLDPTDVLPQTRSAIGRKPLSKECGRVFGRVRSVIDAGLRIDVAQGRRDGYYVRQAAAFVQAQMQTVVAYDKSVASYLGESFSTSDLFGDETLTEPLLGDPSALGDERPLGFKPGDSLAPPDIFGLDFCQAVLDLCVGLYSAAVASSEGDTSRDLIGSVAPDCLCSDEFDPNRIYRASPSAGRDFTEVIRPASGARSAATLQPDVLLIFRGQAITPLSVSPNEIQFKITDSQQFCTGYVYLRRIGPSLFRRTRELQSACGKIIDIPNATLVDPSPRALISVVYPPVIDFFEASFGGISGSTIEAECGKDVVLRWHISLLDPCGRGTRLSGSCTQVDVALRDDTTGQLVPFGPCTGPTGSPDATGDGCATVRVSDNRTYTLETTSRAQVVCGTDSALVTVNRVNFLSMQYNTPHTTLNPNGQPVAAGSAGSFDLVLSCPASQDLTVSLTTSNPAALALPNQVTIPSGTSRLQVNFTTTAGACAKVMVNAPAPSSRDLYVPRGELAYDVYKTPVLRWAPGSPPAQVFEDVPFTVEVETECVPADPGFGIICSLTPPSLVSQPPEIAQISALASNRFRIEVPGLSPAHSQAWQLNVVIPSRNNVSAGQALPIVVLPRPRFRLQISPASNAVRWGREAFYDMAVTPENLFTGTVTLTPPAVLSSAGATPLFQTLAGDPLPGNSLSLSAGPGNTNGPTEHARLLVSTTEGGTRLGAIPFSVAASGQPAGLPIPPHTDTAQAELVVNRVTGQFKHQYMVPNRARSGGGPPFDSPACNNRFSGLYEIVGGSTEVTFFNGVDPSSRTVIAGPIAAIYYLFSRKCRLGLVFDGVPPQFRLQWYNLTFDTATGAPAAGNMVKDLGSGTWQQIWFSPDDSLLLVFSLVSVGSGPAPTYRAELFDTPTGNLLDSDTFVALTVYPRMLLERANTPGVIPNTNQSRQFDPLGRDPGSDPSILPPAIADVYAATLNPAGDRVTVTYRRYVEEGEPQMRSGNPDSQSDLLNGQGNFRSIDLTL